MMGTRSLAELARAMKLPPPPRDARFEGVSTDSRTLNAGDLFVALSGAHFDGHAFVAQAQQRGAAALVCERAVTTGMAQLQVPDALLALGQIAHLNRQWFAGSVVALTGSAGKTTTKEMIAAILGKDAPVLATAGNLNNEIGVPMTLLRLAPEHRYAVIEMGAGKPGDIRYLAELAGPDVALVTNALPAHLQGFGTIESVAATKGQIYDALPADGTAVLNLDDAFSGEWRKRIGSRPLICVSALGDRAAQVRASRVETRDGLARFQLELPDGAIDIQLQMPGVQQVANAVMAAAAALALGIGGAAIRDGLQSLLQVAGRMQYLRGAAGCTLIDDSYNANPGSVRAAIDSLASFGGTRVLVLGNMAELGEQAAALHHAVGLHARARGIEHLLVTGEHAAAVAEGFGTTARSFATQQALIDASRDFDRAGVTMLVKGSRSAAMETVIAALAHVDSTALRARMH